MRRCVFGGKRCSLNLRIRIDALGFLGCLARHSLRLGGPLSAAGETWLARLALAPTRVAPLVIDILIVAAVLSAKLPPAIVAVAQAFKHAAANEAVLAVAGGQLVARFLRLGSGCFALAARSGRRRRWLDRRLEHGQEAAQAAPRKVSHFRAVRAVVAEKLFIRVRVQRRPFFFSPGK